MSARVAAILAGLGCCLTALILTVTGIIGQPAAPKPCDLTQPVYAGTVQTGTWHYTLPARQTVRLPDGDRATCMTDGTLDVHS